MFLLILIPTFNWRLLCVLYIVILSIFNIFRVEVINSRIILLCSKYFQKKKISRGITTLDFCFAKNGVSKLSPRDAADLARAGWLDSSVKWSSSGHLIFEKKHIRTPCIDLVVLVQKIIWFSLARYTHLLGSCKWFLK